MEIMGIMIDGDVLIFTAVPIFTPILDEYSFRFRPWGYHRGPYEFWTQELLNALRAFTFKIQRNTIIYLIWKYYGVGEELVIVYIYILCSTLSIWSILAFILSKILNLRDR